MQRVLLDTLEDDADTDADSAVQPVNSYGNGELDIRRNRSKREDRKHKPRRKQTAFTRRLGPYSRDHAITEIDQRTIEAALMRRVRDELTQHIGGNPTAVERILIERAVVLCLRCCQIDTKIMAGEILTAHDNSYAISWNNALRRTLVDLGIAARAPMSRETDLNDWVTRQARSALVR